MSVKNKITYFQVEDLEQEKAEARKKSHITPAFSLEFIQYYFGM